MADVSSFFDDDDEKVAAIERRRRIRLSVFAYAYEFESKSFISDGEFDEMCKAIDLSVDTGNAEMDAFFRKNFDPSTGMWIRLHPHLDRIKDLFDIYCVLYK